MFIFFLCLVLSVSNVTAKNDPSHDRYSPYYQHTISQTPAADHTTRSTHEPADETESVVGEDLPDDASVSSDESESSQPHGPLGAICAELAQYCSYFANNMMCDSLQRNNGHSLLLFSSVMELMADLADKEVTTVRAETYASDLIGVVSAMRSAFNADPEINQYSEQFPFLQQLFTMQERSHNSEELEVELGIYLHNSLRSPETAKPLVQELFNELNVYAQHKAHDVLDMFHHDARTLLDMASRPLSTDEDVMHRAPQIYRSDAEGRRMRQMSWLCHHASETCMDLSDSIQNNDTLGRAMPLIKQLQAMLSAMSLTYDHLGSETATIRSHDRHELATQFALMIHLLPETAPLRSKHSPESAYLDKCTSLPSAQAKQRFVEEAFSSELDRGALLAEFFPSFERAIDYNLNVFSSSLSAFTNETLASCYWHTTASDHAA